MAPVESFLFSWAGPPRGLGLARKRGREALECKSDWPGVGPFSQPHFPPSSRGAKDTLRRESRSPPPCSFSARQLPQFLDLENPIVKLGESVLRPNMTGVSWPKITRRGGNGMTVGSFSSWTWTTEASLGVLLAQASCLGPECLTTLQCESLHVSWQQLPSKAQPLALGIHVPEDGASQGQLNPSLSALWENYGSCTERGLLWAGEGTPFLGAWQGGCLTSGLLLALRLVALPQPLSRQEYLR